MAEQLCRVSPEIELCWEGFGDPADPTVLLVMGLATQMIAWSDEFCEDLEWTALQRHLKVLGVFARLNYRDSKPQYLENSPRLLRHIRAVAVRYSPLTPLLQILDRGGNAAQS